ncbi:MULTISPECIES: ABC-2 transporter permease [Myroides]|uniref:ABC transporter permease n=1 Tax=Myroides albus TaxID=2562892 RepID=A0A6I3LQQ8_9FLAO|nr:MULTISPECIES: ABC-2 transporter permease [Myroides]MTG98492.1 ABC transporter permease [Myroides albus]MVX34676.1 ABC transporter permease [Myroides sp. LoEW2-1]UVD79515.1 ABC-2 transporter permease [Myroides albus]
MLKILKYSFYDLIRSRWSYIYLLFYLLLGIVLLFLNSDIGKAIITLMNVIIVLVPLISTIFGVMYYYDSREFTELLLALPLKRSTIFFGQYLGVALSLSMSLIIGLGIPFLFYGLLASGVIINFLLLIVTGVFLTFIFSAFSYCIGLKNENKIKGFGYSILLWLFLAIIYDGVLLTVLIVFGEYPLENITLIGTILNPIDLSRILILLRLDISALLGYTGAVFKSFFGNGVGSIISFFILLLWVVFPLFLLRKFAKRKDF